MILVTGAAGKTGRALLRALRARGAAVRAWVRRPEQAPEVQQLGAQEVIVGDMRRPDRWPEALAGVQKVYHIPPNMHPDEETMAGLALTYARQAGVTHFVYHSVLHPQTEKMPHHWHKLRVEEMIFEAGIPFTILQPAPYMQNLLPYWPTIVGEGVYRVPYAPSTRLSLVDLEDVAEVGARVLTEPGHEGAIYELCGTPGMTQEEVATTLGRVLGRPVRAEKWPLDAWEAHARAAGLDPYARDALKRMFVYYERYGLWGNPNVLRWLLGREPTSLEAFVARVTSSATNKSARQPTQKP